MAERPAAVQGSCNDRLEKRLERLAAIVGAPPFMLPWLDRFYEETEVDLALEAAEGLLPGTHPEDALNRSYRRAVLDRDGEAWSPASFHARYELWALYEDWRDIPQSVRDELNVWELDDYLVEVGDGIASVREGRSTEGDQQDYTFLLLEEAEELLRARPAVYLWPCNCRAMMGRCEHSHAVCLRFDNDRGIGWEISPERAVQILRQADHEGLVHTAYLIEHPRSPRHLQLLQRLLLSDPRRREARSGRRVARAPLSCRDRRRRVHTMPPLRETLPLRRHLVRREGKTHADRPSRVPRLRPVLHRLRRRIDPDGSAGACSGLRAPAGGRGVATS